MDKILQYGEKETKPSVQKLCSEFAKEEQSQGT